MSENWITPERWKTGLEEVAPKVYAYIQAHGGLLVEFACLPCGVVTTVRALRGGSQSLIIMPRLL